MRLFFAVLLDENIKNALSGAVIRLKELGATGRFSRPENLHLTLAFLGEMEPQRLDELRSVRAGLAFNPFRLALDGSLGRFAGQDGDILWAALERSESLMGLQHKLADMLGKKGYRLDGKRFSPHLTLGRRMRLPEGWERVKADREAQEVSSIRLMLSERVGGVLTYTDIT